VLLHERTFADQDAARRLVADIQAASSEIAEAHQWPAVWAWRLKDIDARPPAGTDLTPLDPTSFELRASHQSGRLPLVFDGNLDTRWMTGERQAGNEWIAIGLPRPRAAVLATSGTQDAQPVRAILARGRRPDEVIMRGRSASCAWPPLATNRYGAGPRSALMAGLIVFFLAYVYGNAGLTVMGFMPASVMLVIDGWGLVEILIAAVAGAWPRCSFSGSRSPPKVPTRPSWRTSSRASGG
jgi:hypothetical protein